jgi:hypothetical protein
MPQGFVVIGVGAKTLVLEGEIADPANKKINVRYQEPDFSKAINLGTVTQAIADLGSALGVSLQANEITDGIKDIPGVGNIINTAQIRITRLVIDTTTSPKQFEFGLGLDLSNSNIAIGEIKLVGLGITVKKTKA